MSKVFWALFGNDDDGYFGDAAFQAARPRYPKWLLAWVWWWRNPAHNLTFYVIGFKGRAIAYSGPDLNSAGTGKGVVTRDDGKKFPLHIFNIWGRLGYAGWRPNGAFGLKFRKAPK